MGELAKVVAWGARKQALVGRTRFSRRRPPSLIPCGLTACASVPKFSRTAEMTLLLLNFFVQRCLSREATEDYLRQQRSSGSCHTL